jgi:hypothetical protein
MKISLSSSDLAQVQNLFRIRDKNMERAERYNAILDKKGLVQESTSPLLIHEIKPDAYLADPFYQQVHPEEVREKGWHLWNSGYAPHEGFVYDELSIDPNTFAETTRFGFFETAFPFLAIEQNGSTWMSVTPHEINTMTDSFKEVHGKAITFGLGMGYYAFMAANKKDVSSITVIEKDPTVIALFKTHLLPFFPHPEKIRLIEEDAFHYARSMAKEHYDYSFVDLWHLPEDGLSLYLRMRQLEKYSPETEWVYWVETSLLSLLRRAVLVLLEEEIAGSKDEDYDYAATTSDLIINQLHKLLKKKEIKTFLDVHDLLSDASLKALGSLIRL